LAELRLKRRHNLGRGTLVLLDLVPEFGARGSRLQRRCLERLSDDGR